MNNLDKLIEAIHNNPPSAKYGLWPSSTGHYYPVEEYKKALAEYICSTAESVGCDIKRIDESPADKKALLEAIKISINIASGVPAPYAIAEAIISEIITEAASEYLRRHQDFLEEIGHMIMLRFNWLVRQFS